MPNNPLANPFFLPSVRLFAVIFALGLVLVLFFARKDLRAGLKGELGQRYIGWLLIAPLFLLATFTGGFVGVAIVLLFCARVTYEYVHAVGVERSYAIYLYTLIPLTVATASLVPSLYFMLPAGSILLLTLVPILTRRVEDLYLQLSFAGRGYLYAVWSVGHFILLWQLAGPAL
ncbi:MAG TPA: hypothetical protein VER55_03155, partial [Ardenticatenaceae bacterium]|nr:hypothetical protein [Ardenticatenaceae bacterium]